MKELTLWKINVVGRHLGEFYIIAKNPSEVHTKVKQYLDKRDYGSITKGT